MAEQQQAERTIAILGGGSMGQAILGGLIGEAAPPGIRVRVTTRSSETAQSLPSDARVQAVALEAEPMANRAAVRGADVVILAVKPAMIGDVLGEIADDLGLDTLVISVAAGVTTEHMEQRLPPQIAVVRAMPNTPAFVGSGMTGISAGSRADDAAVTVTTALFELVGRVLVVPESQLDALSAISGSGPAYVFLLVEALTTAAEQKGFTHDEARLLVESTFSGSADLIGHFGTEPAELRRRVTSPKGTTERAVAVLQEAHLAELFGRATDAAVARARELAAG